MFERNKWKILRGDKVVIIAGRDKGETGIVSKVIRDDRIPRVIVEGRNLVCTPTAKGLLVELTDSCILSGVQWDLVQNKRAIKRTEDNPGGLISVEVGGPLMH